jgi:hypothetical protein
MGDSILEKKCSGRGRGRGGLVATFRDEHAQPSSWTRTRWLLVAGVLIAVAVAVVLLLVYSGGGGSGGGGGY